ncbi:MAG: iron-containing alcohol dehydrogenase [Candidatus Cloacimonetes bacterium]|nr:iron-containing alcohol dehydrogenase [Candidatus Cloacimonadota bacterium]
MILQKKLKSLISQWPKSVTIIYSPSQSGLIENIETYCEGKYRIQIIKLQGEPDTQWVLNQAVSGKIIVGIGGGSVMDAAKVLSLAPKNEADLSTMFHEMGANPKSVKRKYRLCLIPSNFSSGAWASRTAVISYKDLKMTILGPDLIPDAVLILPELAISLSPELRVMSSYDTLSHWFELYSHVPISEKLWLRSLEGWLEDFTQHLQNTNYQKLFLLSEWLYSDFVPLTISSWPLHVLAHCLQTGGKSSHSSILATLVPRAIERCHNLEPTGKILAQKFLTQFPAPKIPLRPDDLKDAIQRATSISPHRLPDWQPYFDAILDSNPQKP